MPIVVFDFDLTLTHWDTADRYFRWLLKRDWWRLGLVLACVPVIGPLFLVRATRKWPVRFAVWVATLGRSERDLERLAQEHGEWLVASGQSVFIDEGLTRLAAHVEQGHRVVIATGCLELLARTLLRSAGFGHVALVGSTLRPFLGGMVVDRHCFGPNKIPMLAERGFPPPWSIAYTDHHCDLPVLRLSEARFLVSPTPDCAKRIATALQSTPAVLSWR
jgi:phosphatidylglycerophosphatase C